MKKFKYNHAACGLRSDVVLLLGQSSTAYPTFLHFGAAHGLLHTVITCLKICPAALRACALTNKDGKLPREIAQEHGHHFLSEELRLFEVCNIILS